MAVVHPMWYKSMSHPQMDMQHGGHSLHGMRAWACQLTLRSKFWALRLRSKDVVNKQIADFTIYMDQVKKLGRGEREETLTNLFLDSVIDPKFEVTIANCCFKDHISINECFGAVRAYDNVLSREAIQGDGGGKYKIRSLNNNTKQQGKTRIDSGYWTYNEWQKLTPEQSASILEAREKKKVEHKDVSETEQDKETSVTGPSNNIKNKQQRNKRHARRQNVINKMENQETDDNPHEDEGPL